MRFASNVGRLIQWLRPSRDGAVAAVAGRASATVVAAAAAAPSHLAALGAGAPQTVAGAAGEHDSGASLPEETFDTFHELPGSQDARLLNEVHAVRLEVARLDGRFAKVRHRLTESVEREVRLTQQLTQSVRHELQQATALQSAKAEYRFLAAELEAMLASQKLIEQRRQLSAQVEDTMNRALSQARTEIDTLRPLSQQNAQIEEDIELYRSMEEVTGQRLEETSRRVRLLQRRLADSKEAIVGLAAELECTSELEPELREQLSVILQRGRTLAGELSQSRQRQELLESLLESTVVHLESSARLQGEVTEKLDLLMAKATSLAAEFAAVREQEARLAGALSKSHEQEQLLVRSLENVGQELISGGHSRSHRTLRSTSGHQKKCAAAVCD